MDETRQQLRPTRENNLLHSSSTALSNNCTCLPQVPSCHYKSSREAFMKTKTRRVVIVLLPSLLITCGNLDVVWEKTNHVFHESTLYSWQSILDLLIHGDQGVHLWPTIYMLDLEKLEYRLDHIIIVIIIVYIIFVQQTFTEPNFKKLWFLKDMLHILAEKFCGNSSSQ